MVPMVNESTNNTAIFAHYDKDCIIDDYVLFYLKELKNVADRIIFVSDCELDEEQISKLKGIVDYTLAQKHGEYDFGSYKRGIQLAMENGLYENTDNLILLNDSCYGPFGSLKNLFEEMNAKDCDFWGFASNENRYGDSLFEVPEAENMHVQSYFIVLKKQVLHSNAFKDFILSVKKESTKKDIIFNYEMGLTAVLCKEGFKYCAKYNHDIFKYNMIDLFKPKVKEPCLLFKRYCLLWIYFPFILSFWFNKIRKNTQYPVEAIVADLKRHRKFSAFKHRYLKKYLLALFLGWV